MTGEKVAKPGAMTLKAWQCGDPNFEIDVKACDNWREGLVKEFGKEKNMAVSDLKTMCGEIKECKGGCIAHELLYTGRFKIRPEMGRNDETYFLYLAQSHL